MALKKKKRSKLLASLIFIVFILFVFAIGTKIVIDLGKERSSVNTLSYVFSPTTTELSINESVTVPVYLTGQNLKKATALDVKFSYDPKKLRLVKATPGTFYEKALKVKWDDKEAWYALAITPGQEASIPNPAEPVIILEFKAIARGTSATVSTETSTVYIAKTGGFNPENAVVTFNIK